MKVKPFSRHTLVILVIVVSFLGGCRRSQTPRFYALSSMQDQVISKRYSPVQNAIIGIGPVKLADYLDQPRLVNRTSDNQLIVADYDRWVGSFKDNFVNVLADNIGFLLPTERIHFYPWRKSMPIDYQIIVDIVRCDGRLGDVVWLDARWTILQGPEKKLLKMSRSSIRQPVGGSDYAALVAAQSQAIAQLSQEIVEAIRAGGNR
jgi:uncharacterized lipoprotein YmbA